MIQFCLPVIFAISADTELPRPMAPIRVLYFGNSHTASHDVPLLVKQLGAAIRPNPVQFESQTVIGSNLESLATQTANLNLIKNGNWDFVVLQGAQVSSSHQYTYPQDGAIKMAILAKNSGAKALLFSEWPRRGIDETSYTFNVYAGIAKASGAEIVPVGHVWDPVQKQTRAELWAGDGNHSSAKGAMLAAHVILRWLSPNGWTSTGLTTNHATREEHALFSKFALREWQKRHP